MKATILQQKLIKKLKEGQTSSRVMQGSRVQTQPSFCIWVHPTGHLSKTLGRARRDAKNVRKAPPPAADTGPLHALYQQSEGECTQSTWGAGPKQRDTQKPGPSP